MVALLWEAWYFHRMFGEPKKVLVVDDDETLCTMVERYLTKHGFLVTKAHDGKQALEKLQSDPEIRVVLTDLMMPTMDGITFAETLRADARFKNLPVILMTAYPEDELLERGLRKGVALTLSKPINFDQLLTLIGFAAA